MIHMTEMSYSYCCVSFCKLCTFLLTSLSRLSPLSALHEDIQQGSSCLCRLLQEEILPTLHTPYKYLQLHYPGFRFLAGMRAASINIIHIEQKCRKMQSSRVLPCLTEAFDVRLCHVLGEADRTGNPFSVSQYLSKDYSSHRNSMQTPSTPRKF